MPIPKAFASSLSWKQGKFSLEGYTPAKMAAGADAPKAHFPYSPTILFVLLKCFLSLLLVCMMFLLYFCNWLECVQAF